MFNGPTPAPFMISNFSAHKLSFISNKPPLLLDDYISSTSCHKCFLGSQRLAQQPLYIIIPSPPFFFITSKTRQAFSIIFRHREQFRQYFLQQPRKLDSFLPILLILYNLFVKWGESNNTNAWFMHSCQEL